MDDNPGGGMAAAVCIKHREPYLQRNGDRVRRPRQELEDLHGFTPPG
jgi:hypothetical protein